MRREGGKRVETRAHRARSRWNGVRSVNSLAARARKREARSLSLSLSLVFQTLRPLNSLKTVWRLCVCSQAVPDQAADEVARARWRARLPRVSQKSLLLEPKKRLLKKARWCVVQAVQRMEGGVGQDRASHPEGARFLVLHHRPRAQVHPARHSVGRPNSAGISIENSTLCESG